MTLAPVPDRITGLRQLSMKTPTTGLIAEVGVYKGATLRVLAECFPTRPVLGFDTFKGLPAEHHDPSEIHQPGDFSDTSRQEVEDRLSLYPNVRLIQGLFPLSGRAFSEQVFAFVHIDTDLYLSVKLSLEWFWPRMVSGGILVFDDYQWHRCPGVERALTEFGEPVKMSGMRQAYITHP